METSRKICKRPSSYLSIDEMMTSFMGRSIQTYRMKFKPVSEGYKSWALCDATTGFVYAFQAVSRVDNSNVRELKALVDGLSGN